MKVIQALLAVIALLLGGICFILWRDSYAAEQRREAHAQAIKEAEAFERESEARRRDYARQAEIEVEAFRAKLEAERAAKERERYKMEQELDNLRGGKAPMLPPANPGAS